MYFWSDFLDFLLTWVTQRPEMVKNRPKSPIFGQKMTKKLKKLGSKPKRRKMAHTTVKIHLLTKSLALVSILEPPEDRVGSYVTFFEKCPVVGTILLNVGQF